jgi:hypothetical protein
MKLIDCVKIGIGSIFVAGIMIVLLEMVVKEVM